MRAVTGLWLDEAFGQRPRPGAGGTGGTGPDCRVPVTPGGF
jgi:hypothetical protein